MSVQAGDPGAIACPRCGAAVGAEQDWCLRCGAAARTRLVPAPGWRAPVALATTLAVLAVAALGVAFLALTADDEPPTPPTQPAPVAPALP